MCSKSYDSVAITVFGPKLPNITQRDINVTSLYRLLALQAF
jgi:hypothetical protein